MLKRSQEKSVRSTASKAVSKKSEARQPGKASRSATPVAVTKSAINPSPLSETLAPRFASRTPKPVEEPAPVAAVPMPPASKTVKAVFELHAPEARQVLVCGEFNGWQPEGTPMSRRADGTWETSIVLRPGRYQYKFVVDGNWIHDPNAKVNVPNDHFSLNSVIEVLA
jgi:hypothetical protein